MDKIYVVTAVDCGETCDGRARVIGAFKSEDDAKNYVRNDMEQYIDNRANCGLIVDFDEMSVVREDDDAVCLWNVEAVEVK